MVCTLAERATKHFFIHSLLASILNNCEMSIEITGCKLFNKAHVEIQRCMCVCFNFATICLTHLVGFQSMNRKKNVAAQNLQVRKNMQHTCMYIDTCTHKHLIRLKIFVCSHLLLGPRIARNIYRMECSKTNYPNNIAFAVAANVLLNMFAELHK